MPASNYKFIFPFNELCLFKIHFIVCTCTVLDTQVLALIQLLGPTMFTLRN